MPSLVGSEMCIRDRNEGNGTPERNIFFANLCICIADQHRGTSSAMNRGSSSSRSSSTAAVVAATSPQRRRRAPLWRVGLLFYVSVTERVLCILALGHSPAAAWLFTAAAYLLRCCCCDDHGRRREEDPSPSDWNTLPSEPSDPSHCLLERSTRSTRCRVANSITENTMIDLKHSNSNFLYAFFTGKFLPSGRQLSFQKTEQDFSTLWQAFSPGDVQKRPLPPQ